MTQPLFVYGSMRDDDVRALVLGCAHREVRAEPAWMRDAAVAQVPGESYPYLVSVEGAHAPGEVLYGLDETGLDRIHFFEGDEYAFMGCDVERSGSGRIGAMHFGGGRDCASADRCVVARAVAGESEGAVSFDDPGVHGGVAARDATRGRGVVAAPASRALIERRQEMSAARLPGRRWR